MNPIMDANSIGRRPIRTGLSVDDLPYAGAWTTREERILRETYPTGGATACMPLLPQRTRAAIRQRFYILQRKAPIT